MQARQFLKITLAATIACSLTSRAMADGGDLLGGIVGGMIGAAIVNGANQQQRSTQPRRTSTLSSADRARNVEVQTALNHFGFPVGRPDGVLGQRSRGAISQYQALLAFPPTGALTEMERQILLTGYQRALMGGPQITKIVSSSPVGLQGVLLAQRDEMFGTGGGTQMQAAYGGLPPEIAEAVDEIARNSGIEGDQLVQRAGFIQLADMNGDGRSDYLMDTSVTGSGFWCTGEACAVRVFLSAPDGFRRNDFQMADPTPASFLCAVDVCRVQESQPQMAAQPAPEPAAPAAPDSTTVMAAAPAPEAAPEAATEAAPAPALPSFAAAIAAPKVSFAAHCQAVADKTAGRGGMVQTIALIDDPTQALGEQFCGVAAAARTDGEALMSQVQGFTPDQIADQCKAFAAALTDRVATVASDPRDSVLSDMQAWLGTAGMPADQLVGTARICMSIGYARDDADMALASALVLAGTGNMIYGEIIGHHLAAGVGADRSPERAIDWFDGAAAAVKAGQTPVFLADQGDRIALVQRAAAMVAGKASAPPLLPIAPATVPASATAAP